jgi:hypothetical protein
VCVLFFFYRVLAKHFNTRRARSDNHRAKQNRPPSRVYRAVQISTDTSASSLINNTTINNIINR